MLGEDEIRDGQLAVKFLRSGDQQLNMGRDEAGDWIRKYIDSRSLSDITLSTAEKPSSARFPALLR